MVDIKSNIVANINEHRLDILMKVIEMQKKQEVFTERLHELKYLPSVFTQESVDALNNIFKSIYDGIMSFDKFTTTMNRALDQFTLRGIYTAELEGVNVLDELYRHCKKKQNVLILKSNGLIYSAICTPTSPMFLKVVKDNIFKGYIYPVMSKPFISWVNNFHEFIIMHKALDINRLIKLVIINCGTSVNNFNEDDINHLYEYIKMYHMFVINNKI